MILASLGLLVAGAITPLLTTERFYFFSNTFSLASGLQELVANQQILIAVVIGLFSLCIPVVKGIVIWIAASEKRSHRRLLAIADRFGKWSMLEVFVAALLIVALKLGPVVDATLHYGAYLLAASVLLAGIASQVLVHGRRAHLPLFSSPVTLTIGAIGGAVAATVLIGIMNPGWLRFEAIVGTPETRCIQRVFQLDRLYADTSASQTDYVGNLQLISTANCPAEFSAAFDNYLTAWQQLETYDNGDNEEPGWLDRAGALVGLIATRDDTLEDIEDAWNELAAIALDYEITAPTR